MQMNQNQPAFNEGFESLPEDVQRKIDPEGKADEAPAMVNVHADGPAAYDGLSKVKGKKGTSLGDQKYTYKGKPVASIPPYYRKWMVDNITWGPWNIKIKEEIERLSNL